MSFNRGTIYVLKALNLRRRFIMNKRVQTIAAIAGAAIICGAGGYYLSTKQSSTKIKTLNQQLEAVLAESASTSRTVYVPIDDIKTGKVIKKKLVQAVEIKSSVDASSFLTEADFGKTALVTLPAGTPIYSCCVSTEFDPDSEGLREVETSYLWLGLNTKEDDFVDLRIMYPNGEDYVIASKKQVKSLNFTGNLAYFWLTEDELLRLNGAVVDAAIKPGAKIYTTVYVQPELQDASKVTYTPNADVISVIAESPNIVNESAKELSKVARLALEKRIAEFKEKYPDLTIEDIIKNHVLNEAEVPAEGANNADVQAGDSNVDQDIQIGDVSDDTDVSIDAPSDSADDQDNITAPDESPEPADDLIYSLD